MHTQNIVIAICRQNIMQLTFKRKIKQRLNNRRFHNHHRRHRLYRRYTINNYYCTVTVLFVFKSVTAASNRCRLRRGEVRQTVFERDLFFKNTTDECDTT